jgi:glycogen synthase
MLDPWLRWWNSPGANLVRSGLELSGQRNRYDGLAPTHLMKGYDRVPEIFGPPRTVSQVLPNSISVCRFDRIYFCSQGLKSAAEQAGFQVGHGDVIYPGIPTEMFLAEIKALGAPIRRLLIVSRLAEGCGVMTALKALKQVRESELKVTLSIYGRGESEYVSQLRSFVVQHQLPVEFLTVSNVNRDLAAVYRQHDALIYTSEVEEAFVSTPLEAMASGLPVIGAFMGGARELLRHGENAFIYTPGETVELASRIQELHLQPALRRQMTEVAQAEVSTHFSETQMMDRIESFLSLSLELWGKA